MAHNKSLRNRKILSVSYCFAGADRLDPFVKSPPSVLDEKVIQPRFEKFLWLRPLRKGQTFEYATYASGLTFSRALPERFLNRLPESTFTTDFFVMDDLLINLELRL
ncbi:MAG: hypothetical protein PHH28_16975 [Desulfuromonadaceae bacterium]|nr:hypothetical protein [Desulfuromonadaceae bacterium]